MIASAQLKSAHCEARRAKVEAIDIKAQANRRQSWMK